MGRKSNKKKRIRTYALLATLAILAIALGVLLGGKISGVLFSGQDLFTNPTEVTVQLPSPTPEPIPITAAPIQIPTAVAATAIDTAPPMTPMETEVPSTPRPVATADAYDELAKVADTGMMDGIVNILFIGVDYEAARIDKKWAGKDGNAFHSDVMIVCAVNFNENRVDLISLPRDTYANIPGVEGVYKLNAALNCGTDGTHYGLFCENGEGFQKVCEAAEWMLGGIDVDYYYAVTMESVKQIVDIVGGVWYNLEGNFDNGGRYYKAGFQYMDGQACLDYMRVRKAGHGQLETGDSNRVKRQKNMMVAIFKKMKEENMVLKVPEILAAFDGALFTNCTPEQTAALALFGYKLDPEDIGAHSMGGDMATLFHWNFNFTNQSDRVKLIKKIYGVDVKTYPKYSLAYGRYTWCKMLQDKYMDNCNSLKSYVQKLLDEDNNLPADEDTSDPRDDTPTKPKDNTPSEPDDPDSGSSGSSSSDSGSSGSSSSDSGSSGSSSSDSGSSGSSSSDSGSSGSSSSDSGSSGSSGSSSSDSGSSGSSGSSSSDSGSSSEPSSDQDTEASDVERFIRYLQVAEGSRKYSEEQRKLFSEFKSAFKELKSLYSSADKEAKKAANHKSNSLSGTSNALLDQMIKTQDLAIAVAKSFNFTKIKNFTVTDYPNDTYRSSAWSLSFWTNKKYNAIKVNFN